MGTEAAHAITPPAEGPSWDELKVGLKVGPLVHTITAEMVRDFCAAMPADAEVYENQAVMPPTLLATDYIPLLRGHLELGYSLHDHAHVSHLMTQRFGRRWTDVGEMSLAFIKPVCAGDDIVVQVDARPVQWAEALSAGKTTLQADVTNQLGELVAAGTVSVVE